MDNPNSLQALIEGKRLEIAERLDKQPHHVLSKSQIEALVKHKPRTLDELKQTDRYGFGKEKLKTCAIQVLQVIRDYCHRVDKDCIPLSEKEMAEIRKKLGIKSSEEEHDNKKKKQQKLILKRENEKVPQHWR